MENTAIVLIIITLFLLVIIVGLLTLLIYKLMKERPTENNSPKDLSDTQFHPAIMERIKQLEKIKPPKADIFCSNHPDEPGEVMCSICDKLYCRACIKPFKSMHFCKEHLPLVMRHEWDEVLTLKTSTSDPEQGVKLYEIKKQLYDNEDIPTYVETHYKINVDQDHIETYLVLFGIKESVTAIRERLTNFNING